MLDAYSRVFAETYTARYNQPAVVDDRPGASGIIAIEAMLAAHADGYTVVMGTTGMFWQARVLYRNVVGDGHRRTRSRNRQRLVFSRRARHR